jgi:branched-chain amino acid transport system substrate-binding protein
VAGCSRAHTRPRPRIQEDQVRFRSILGVTVAVALAATSAAACKSSSSGGGGNSNSTTGSATTSAGGGSGKTVTIATDLPLQGSNKDTNDATNKLIQLYLDQQGGKAGNYNVKLSTYDDSIASTGSWDPATCTSNANKHVTTTSEIAVMGTYNSGCAKLEVPILNAAPMLMVSDANTNPGLTKTWDPGEPDKYYPSGKRNYARVVTTDDFQGSAAADFAKETLKVTKCYIVNDNSTYGQGVARAFEAQAKKDGITVLGNDAWDSKASNYTALFTKIKAKNPDCLYIGGTYDLNGGQLVKDKFNVLGDNTKVKMLGPDGFTGYPALDKQSQSQGMYLTFAGLASEQLLKQGGAGGKLLEAYKAKYGAYPVGNYPLYGVAAVQVIMAAIAKSDGTRQGVVNQVFGTTPITIPADQSVLGKELVIDPKSGDVNAKDISVLVMKNNAETFLQAQSVK